MLAALLHSCPRSVISLRPLHLLAVPPPCTLPSPLTPTVALKSVQLLARFHITTPTVRRCPLQPQLQLLGVPPPHALPSPLTPIAALKSAQLLAVPPPCTISLLLTPTAALKSAQSMLTTLLHSCPPQRHVTVRPTTAACCPSSLCHPSAPSPVLKSMPCLWFCATTPSKHHCRSLLPPPPFTRTAPAAPLQVFDFVHPSSFTPWFCATVSPKHHCSLRGSIPLCPPTTIAGPPHRVHSLWFCVSAPCKHYRRYLSILSTLTTHFVAAFYCPDTRPETSAVACTISRHLETAAMLRADPRPLLQLPVVSPYCPHCLLSDCDHGLVYLHCFTVVVHCPTLPWMPSTLSHVCHDTNIFSNFSLTLPTGDEIPNIVKIAFDQHEGEHSSCRSLVWQIQLFNDLTAGDNASQWIVFIKAWVQHCIAIQLPLPSAVRLFIDVLWAQRQGRQYDALQLLVGAQVQSIKAVQVQINIQEDTDMLGNLDHEDNFSSDPKDDISMVLDDYEDSDESEHSDEYSDESEHSDDPTATLLAQCIGWGHSLHLFFDTTSFAQSGLCKLIEHIINPHFREEINRRHIHYKSTPPEYRVPATPRGKGQKKVSLQEFLQGISDPRFTVAMYCHCQQVFFPSSEENWHFEWSRLVLPTLRSMALHWTHPIDDWDVYDLWRRVSEANVRTFQLESPGTGWEQLQFVLLQAQLEREHAKDVKRQWSCPRLDKSHPKVEPRIHQPSNSRSSPSTAKAEILGTRPPPPKTRPVPYGKADADAPEFGGCLNCAHKDPEFCCYYKVPVLHRTEVEIKAWRSAFLTCAPAHDFRDTGNATMLLPTALKFIEIAHCPDVYQDCQGDVGGVQFLPWDDETLYDMWASHALVGCYATPTTRSDYSQSEGTLTPVGSRQASGGAKVRGFAPKVVADLHQIIKKAGLNRVVTGTNLGPCAANSGSGHCRLIMSTTLPMLNGGATSKLLRTVYGFSTHVNSMEQCFLENPLAYLVPYPVEPTPPST
ncbi:hypothetical protein B0H10DRAFT_1960768 [Mycena sp. CBHHK59/15]|nr:hypothetical protein B0H10DRAFT_1960768 [Mycena sp. CBHHK59/15]